MDYGKLAYLRLDELEQKVENKTALSEKERNVSAFFSPCEYIESGKKFDVTYITGKGVSTIIVSINANILAPGTVTVLIDDKIIAVNEINNIGEFSFPLFNSVKLDSEAALSIVATGGLKLTLKSVQVVLIGYLVDIVRDMSDTGVDYFNNLLGVLLARDGQLYFKQCDLSSVDISGGINIGIGKKCDLIACKNYFAAVYVDIFENLWGIIFGSDNSVKRKYLCAAEDFTSIALCELNGRFIVGYSANGKAYYFTASKDFSGKSTDVYIETNIKCESLKFVKNADLPTIVYTGGGKSYMKFTENEFGADESVTATISVNLS